MIIFSSPEAALKEGFRILDFDREYQLYIVEKDISRKPHRAKICAFARCPKKAS